jgi:hypothetical protein
MKPAQVREPLPAKPFADVRLRLYLFPVSIDREKMDSLVNIRQQPPRSAISVIGVALAWPW